MAQSKDMKLYQEWLILCEQIKKATPLINESDEQKKKRKAAQLDDFNTFARHYFPHYIDADFGWFHLKAAEAIKNDPKIFAVLEWPREHAKSVFANVMIPLWLYARGELSGMITVSANQDKAITLLSDLQAEFTSNRRWIDDYGDLAKMGDWREGAFATSDGMGFWAFGRKQSPRGVRKAANRPNLIIWDDIDDKEICRNTKRVKEVVEWLLEDLYGAGNIKGTRMIGCGNRIHKQSILAHIVGDVDPEDPKRPGIFHQKVYAIEHRSTHTMADFDDKTSRPAWKERYTKADFRHRKSVMGTRAYNREYFHQHSEEGNVFQPEQIHYIKPLPFNRYKMIVTYTDPSFKAKADYKAVITAGTDGQYIDILEIWLKQSSVSAMVHVNYDRWEKYGSHSRYYMEANMIQDILLKEFRAKTAGRTGQIPIRGDKRKKPDKEARIENMEPLFERGIVRFSEKIRQAPDTQVFIQQLLGFPYGHDDGPDALEGSIHFLQKMIGGPTSGGTTRMGRYNLSTKYS